MGRSQDTWNKRETEKKKQKKRKDKEQRKEERKAQSKHGNNLDEMLAYVDENGNLTTTPPDPTKKRQEIKEEDIQVSVPKQEGGPIQTVRTGSVAFFNDSKGYGFIKDDETGESVFVHVNDTAEPIKERDKVTFEVEMGHKGPMAVKVRLIKG
jgi:cold shock CspA family protein